MKKNKLSKLRKKFIIYYIDGYIIPKNDEFFGEYVDSSHERLKYLTGFSGSAGQALVLKNKAFFRKIYPIFIRTKNYFKFA